MTCLWSRWRAVSLALPPPTNSLVPEPHTLPNTAHPHSSAMRPLQRAWLDGNLPFIHAHVVALQRCNRLHSTEERNIKLPATALTHCRYTMTVPGSLAARLRMFSCGCYSASDNLGGKAGSPPRCPPQTGCGHHVPPFLFSLPFFRAQSQVLISFHSAKNLMHSREPTNTCMSCTIIIACIAYMNKPASRCNRLQQT